MVSEGRNGRETSGAGTEMGNGGEGSELCGKRAECGWVRLEKLGTYWGLELAHEHVERPV